MIVFSFESILQYVCVGYQHSHPYFDFREHWMVDSTYLTVRKDLLALTRIVNNLMLRCIENMYMVAMLLRT